MSSSAVAWTKGRKATLGVIGVGATIIAGIGFWGSYQSVKELAREKGFGNFAPAFPIGIDVGIVVLLAFDLFLTSIRLGSPWLRYVAWVLTGATIVFNAAAAWPDLLGSAMHGAIPLLFIAVVEACRGALAKINKLADRRRLDSIRLPRWVIAPRSTFRIWRRMVLWEIPDFQTALRLDQQAQLLRMELRDEHGPRWRRLAGRDALKPLRALRAGVPIDAEALAAPVIGIPRTPPLNKPDPAPALERLPEPAPAAPTITAQEPAPATPEPPADPAELPTTAIEVPAATAAAGMPRVDPLPHINLPTPPAPPTADTVVRAPVAPVAAPIAPEADGHAWATAAPAPDVHPKPDPAPLPEAAGRELEQNSPAAAPVAAHHPEPVRQPEGPGREPEPVREAEAADEAHLVATGPDADPALFDPGAEPSEDQQKRAERIYLECKREGRKLSGADLARQAGYSPAHGRRLLRQFVEQHGAIEVSATQDELTEDGADLEPVLR
ncbi:DUF2637 domain-containing protein [Kitasatospora sp. MBT66]|uniref:DUF2637 domain-containing protein n=1 Tax=Kitasatospora sp. MBT66 TaxID=1444769 RepID=UPI00068B7BB7|nr:DUF2637 domain-containing protein [Kitasatospora sp. MBT66]